MDMEPALSAVYNTISSVLGVFLAANPRKSYCNWGNEGEIKWQIVMEY